MTQIKPALSLLVLIATASTALAVPRQVNVQAALRDAAGAPIGDGARSITFRVYADAGGAILLWEEVQQRDVLGGVLDALLPEDPAGAPFSGEVDALLDVGAPLWLSVEAAGQDELPPVALVSVPYAMTADRALVAAALSCDGCVGADQLGVSVSAVALPYDDAATQLGAGTIQAAIERLATRVDDLAAALAAHADDAAAHHPEDLAGIDLHPASVTVGSTTLSDGAIDLGDDADDALTAAIVATLTGGPDSNADTLHTHAGAGAGGGGPVTLIGIRMWDGNCHLGDALPACPNGYVQAYQGEWCYWDGIKSQAFGGFCSAGGCPKWTSANFSPNCSPGEVSAICRVCVPG